MAHNPLLTALSISAIVLSLVSAYYSLVIYRYNRLSKGWLTIVVAHSLVPVLLIIRLLHDFTPFVRYHGLLDTMHLFVLPFFYTLFLFIGVSSMKRSFERFELVEKGMAEKANGFNEAKRKR